MIVVSCSIKHTSHPPALGVGCGWLSGVLVVHDHTWPLTVLSSPQWLTFSGVCAYVCQQEKVTIRAKKLVKNNLLRRRQFIIDVIHPGKANVSKADLKVRLVMMWLYGCERMSVKYSGDFCSQRARAGRCMWACPDSNIADVLCFSQKHVQAAYDCDPETIVLFGFRNKFGGDRSSGFCLIYENLEVLKKFEPKYRLARLGLGGNKPMDSSRKKIKELKNRQKKVWGLGRRVVKKKARRAAAQEE